MEVELRENVKKKITCLILTKANLMIHLTSSFDRPIVISSHDHPSRRPHYVPSCAEGGSVASPTNIFIAPLLP